MIKICDFSCVRNFVYLTKIVEICDLIFTLVIVGPGRRVGVWFHS